MQAPEAKRCNLCADANSFREQAPTEEALEFVAKKLVEAFPVLELQAAAELFEQSLETGWEAGHREAVMRVSLTTQPGARREPEPAQRKNFEMVLKGAHKSYKNEDKKEKQAAGCIPGFAG